MQRILWKRVLRDLKRNVWRYLALGSLIILGMYMVVSLVGAAETVITRVDQKAEENKLEDGEFSVFVPLTKAQEQEISDEGVSLEHMFYLDYELADASTIRVFENRQNLNRIAIDEGTTAKNRGEAVIEKRYSVQHDLSLGERIQVGDQNLKIVGIGSVPDYDAVYQNLSDNSVDSNRFGLVFVNESQYQTFEIAGNSKKSATYSYAYRLNNEITDAKLKKQIKNFTFSLEDVQDPYFKEYQNESTSNLIQFLKAADNPRIKASANDQVINKIAGLIAGIIVMTLFTYVISVFVIHGMEQESSVIGALYALGVKKKDLLLHYLTLPVFVTLLAGIIGTALGFSKYGINPQMQDCYNYFSLPAVSIVCPIYLILYGTVMPPVVAAVVNYIVINQKLSQPALKLIRNEQKQSKGSKINLGKMGFVRRFQIRQMLREARTGFTVIFGMFVAMLVLMMGVDCYILCHNISVKNKADTKYEYMYTYKYPTMEIPEGGTACYAKSLSKEIYGYNLDVTLLGTDQSNPYFDAAVTPGKNKVIISTSLATKYHLKTGEQLTLTDKENDRTYTFTIEGATQYSVGLYAFMDIDSMRELFGQNPNYYNVVFSDKSLQIEAGRLYAINSKKDISKSSDVFIEKMMPMLIMLTAVSVIMFCSVMYLMMKVMVDRASLSISLLKIFGYRTGEIRKLYLNGNFYIIAVGAAVCIPLAKKLMDAMYPWLISNVGCGADLSFTWLLYPFIYAWVILLYFIINSILVGRLKKVLPAEVLKNRE